MSGSHGPVGGENEHILTPHDMQTNAIVANLVRYYNLDSDLDSFSDETASNNDTFEEIEATVKPVSALPAGAARLRDDPTLVALAQLGTLHLKCDRSFISLLDTKDQYILAEATPSVSLQDSSKCRPGENVAIGAARMSLGFGVCPLTIRAFREDDSPLDQSTYLLPEAKDIYFMKDMTEVDAFKFGATVTQWPFLKFYAGIPLRTQEGHVIGMFSVADSTPRDGLTIEEIEKMRELASVIIDHLHLVQIQDRLERSRNMIGGLGRFVDGRAVQQLWKDAFDGQLNSLPEEKPQLADSDVGFANTLSSQSPLSLSHTLATTTTLFRDVSDVSSPLKDSDYVPTSAAATRAPTSRSATDIAEQFHGREFGGAGYFKNQDSNSSVFESAHDTHSGESEAPFLQEEDVNVAIKTLFTRASHWVRKACDFDGILFVDASIQDIRPRKDQRGRRIASKMPDATPAFDNQNGESRSCDLLGFSLQAQPRSTFGFPSTVQVEIPQSTLSGLLRKYPRGKVFQFDEYGHLLQTETIDDETRKVGKDFVNKKKQQVKFERDKDELQAYQLLEICPGARSIAFFPLWDPHRDQWYAGSLAWSLDPVRVLQHEELMFLGAFGSCVMAEKSKIDMLNADRDKQDFISSVSHELRTPLHGILASIDSLADMVSELAQDEIRTINICGDVLLDTMDHILDYSKISRDSQKLVKTAGSRHKVWQETTNPAGRLDSFDFSKLIENVVEGTFAGFSYRNIPASPRPSHERKTQIELYRSTRITPPNMSPNVMVVLEIEHTISWLFESQIGAWKRILTNALGNALKYTQTGFVRVSLQVTASKNDSDSIVTLQIEDSGIGMSKEFLKHGVYTPFVQANPLSVGTGLGLSIVRQLVDDLDGIINIQSEIDYGTRITIKAPLSISSSEELDLTATGTNASIRDIAAWCKGLTICLVGFDYYPEIDEIPTGILNVHSRKMLAIRSSIASCASDWYGLNIKQCLAMSEAEGDILVGLSSQIDFPEYGSRRQPLIVVEDARTGIRPPNGDGMFYLSQPFGPHKFGRILGLCLEYRSSVPEPGEMPETPSLDTKMAWMDIGATVLTQHHDPVAIQRPVFARRSSQTMKPPPLERRSSGYSNVNQRGLSGSSARQLLTEPVSEPKPRSIVLLVEDNFINMKILINLMKKANQRHQSAINGLEALLQYQANPSSIKVIFMDISMPIKDGIQATKEIRQFEAENSLPRVRIVAVTCFSSTDVQRNAFQSGVDMFTLKPTPMKALKPILDMDPDHVVPP